jgi:hypothetical protein
MPPAIELCLDDLQWRSAGLCCLGTPLNDAEHSKYQEDDNGHPAAPMAAARLIVLGRFGSKPLRGDQGSVAQSQE